jgi:hypothetical protein
MDITFEGMNKAVDAVLSDYPAIRVQKGGKSLIKPDLWMYQSSDFELGWDTVQDVDVNVVRRGWAIQLMRFGPAPEICKYALSYVAPGRNQWFYFHPETPAYIKNDISRQRQATLTKLGINQPEDKVFRLSLKKFRGLSARSDYIYTPTIIFPANPTARHKRSILSELILVAWQCRLEIDAPAYRFLNRTILGLVNAEEDKRGESGTRGWNSNKDDFVSMILDRLYRSYRRPRSWGSFVSYARLALNSIVTDIYHKRGKYEVQPLSYLDERYAGPRPARKKCGALWKEPPPGLTVTQMAEIGRGEGLNMYAIYRAIRAGKLGTIANHNPACVKQEDFYRWFELWKGLKTAQDMQRTLAAKAGIKVNSAYRYLKRNKLRP